MVRGGGYIETKPTGKNSESDSLFRWFQIRTQKKNKNVICVVVGETGSGKSYSCLRIAERMAEINKREFDIRNISRDIEEFMDRVNSGDLKSGDVLVLEEVGVNISSRDWASKMNKLINYVFQTFRNKNLIVLLNIPDVMMLDINTRRLLHGTIQPQGIDFKNKLTKIKFVKKQHNFQLHKDYHHFLKVRVNGRVRKIKNMTLNKPSDEICKLYEKRRDEFTEELNKRVSREILQERSRRKFKNSPFKRHSQTLVWKLYHDFIREFDKKPKLEDMGRLLNKAPSTVNKRYSTMDDNAPDWREIKP